MAKPRVFISSTFFDLRQVRTDLERFINDLGYTAVRNETGGIVYGKDQKLEEYCYKEISQIDILVGIVGGRFGSEADSGNYSITQIEIKTALDQDKQVYLFIEKNVLAEYETYLINKTNSSTNYRFVDDVRVYKFIEELYLLPKNNIIYPFETAQDITQFLKEQWAGLFHDLISQRSKASQYENINLKVNELTVVASTIQTYLENVLQNVSKKQSETHSLIKQENERINRFHFEQTIASIGYINHLESSHYLSIETIIEGLKTTETLSEFVAFLHTKSKRPTGEAFTYGCMESTKSLKDINRARKLLGKSPYHDLPSNQP
jgi:hypothetical protein